MPVLELDQLTRIFSGRPVVDGISLAVPAGECLAVVGPTGSGKTTLLRLVAGLETPTAGRILHAGRDLAAVPPAERGCALLFDEAALYPHLCVRDNLALGRTADGRRHSAENVAEAVRRFRLEPLLDASPQQLSAGQRQQVALARVALRRPAILLLDEPSVHLDPVRRQALRSEVGRLLAEGPAAALFVTHDPLEAQAVGHRVAVLCEGRLAQLGPPGEVYRRPASRFVAEFFAPLPLNLFTGTVATGAQWPAMQMPAARLELPGCRVPAGVSEAACGVRPERLRLDPPPAGTVRPRLAARVTRVVPQGMQYLVELETAPGPWRALVDEPPAPGSQVTAWFEPADLLWFDAASGSAL